MDKEDKDAREDIRELYLAGKFLQKYKDFITESDVMQVLIRSKITTPRLDGISYKP